MDAEELLARCGPRREGHEVLDEASLAKTPPDGLEPLGAFRVPGASVVLPEHRIS